MMRLTKRSIIIYLAIAAAIATAAFFGRERILAAIFATPATRPSAASGVAIVSVASPIVQSIARPLELPATVEAYEQSELYAKITGYLNEVRVDIGDVVKQGDVLAVIHDPELPLELDEAKAQKSQKAAISEASVVSIAQSKQSLETLQGQLNRYKTELELQEITYKRKEELFAGNGIPRQDLDEAKARRDLAAADVTIAQAKIHDAEAQVRSAEAMQKVASAEVDVAKAKIGRIESLMQYMNIVAPFDGIITKRYLDRGALVQAATANRTSVLFTIQRNDKMRVVVAIPEAEASFVKAGDAVSMKIYNSTKPTIQEKIARVASSLNSGSRTMRAEINLANTDGSLLHGTYCLVRFALEPRANALTISSASILREGSNAFVFTIKDEHAARVAVAVGLDDGKTAEILKGLEKDAKVVVTGKEMLRPGMAVNVKASP